VYLITWITTHLPTVEDGWVSWPRWLTDSGRLNRDLTHPASSLAQDRESSPAETSVLTTMLRRQRLLCGLGELRIIFNRKMEIQVNAALVHGLLATVNICR